MQKPHNTELIFFWVLFGAVLVLSYFVFAPYLTVIFLSVVLAIVLNRPYKWLVKKTHGKKNLSATIMTIIATVLILVPTFIVGTLLANEVVDAYNYFTQSGGSSLVGATSKINSLIERMTPAQSTGVNLTSFAETFLQYISGNLNKFFMSIASVFFDSMLLVIALFFFLRDGEKLKDFALKWSPLPEDYNKSILKKLESAISAVVKGTIVIAIIQGIFVGIGLGIFGVPGALILSFIAMIGALIPIVGTGIITLPAVIYLAITGSYLSAFALALWSVVLVGNLDTLLRPLLLEKDLNLHPFVIILSVIGGISFFGPIGFVAGPIVITLLFVLFDIYPSIVSGRQIKNGDDIIES